jgi:Tol biopolymer transport system component
VVRISIGLLLAALAVGVAQAAPSRDLEATRARALLTVVLPKGGICAVRANGSHGVRLSARWRVADLAWSPNGRFVAFVRATRGGQDEIFVADSRGTIRSSFGIGSLFNGPPLWSPDGLHIAYLATNGQTWSLQVARPDGSDDHGVAGSGWPPGWGPNQPAWSPDAQRIAFYLGTDHPNIYSVRIDGSDRRLLVESAARPAYSPDGTKLAYVGYGTENTGVFVANADGSDPHRVSSRALSWDAWGPDWSPDGTLVAFRSLASSELVVASTDGSGDRVIAAPRGALEMTGAPQWSPDGKLVAFTEALPGGARPSKSAVGVARADGGGWHVIVSRVAWNDLHSVAWRPAAALPAAKRATCPRR